MPSLLLALFLLILVSWLLLRRMIQSCKTEGVLFKTPISAFAPIVTASLCVMSLQVVRAPGCPSRFGSTLFTPYTRLPTLGFRDGLLVSAFPVG